MCLTKAKLSKEYFGWMVDIIRDGNRNTDEYQYLLSYLYSKPFYYTLPMDMNRENDGIGLRYKFGRVKNYPDAIIATELDDTDCSVLEVMIALAIRCEDQFAYDPEYGDRTGVWFWEMIESLGLMDEMDANFDIDYVQRVIDRFLSRNYQKNGKGGLFTIHDLNRDMRKTDIWYQMCAYLNEVL